MPDRARLVVFDCDGTLVDSHHLIVSCVQRACERVGLDVPAAASVRDHVGLSLDAFVAEVLPGASAAEVAAIGAYYREEFSLARARDGADPLFPGVLDLLRDLVDAGVSLGIATGKSRRGLERVLDEHALRPYFVTLQTADDAPSKPHPAMVRQAIEEAGARPQETVMVGDTVYDVLAAVAAGAGAIGVAWGAHPASRLLAAGAGTVVDDVEALGRALATGEDRARLG